MTTLKTDGFFLSATNPIATADQRDLVQDTMASIEKMYAHFGIPLSDHGRTAMAKYLAENPREARPAHKFNAGSNEAIAQARRAYKHYQDYFGIPNET